LFFFSLPFLRWLFLLFLCSCSVLSFFSELLHLFFFSFSFRCCFLCTRFLFCLPRSFYRVVTFSLSQVNSKRAGYIFFFTQFNLLREGARRWGGGGALFGLYTHTHTHAQSGRVREREGRFENPFFYILLADEFLSTYIHILCLYILFYLFQWEPKHKQRGRKFIEQ